MIEGKACLLEIEAVHCLNSKKATMSFYSIKQAKFFNKHFKDFRIVTPTKKRIKTRTPVYKCFEKHI